MRSIRSLSLLASFVVCGTAAAQCAERAIFVANNGKTEGSVSSFTLGADGRPVLVQKLILGAIAGSNRSDHFDLVDPGDPGVNATSMALSPDGRYLAVGHATAHESAERISIIEVSAQGALSLHGVATTPDSPLALVWLRDDRLAVTKSSLSGSNQVIVYAFDPGRPDEDTLVAIDAKPTGTFTTSLAMNRSRSLLFANDTAQTSISAFAIRPDGTLESAGVISTAPHYPLGLASSASGDRVYGGGGISGDGHGIVTVNCSVASGALHAPLELPSASAGAAPKLVALHERGTLAFVGHGTDATVRAFTIDEESGALTATEFQIDVGLRGSLGDVAVVGDMLYLTDTSALDDGERGVRTFAVGADGSMSALGGAVDTTGDAPTSIVAWIPPRVGADIDKNGSIDASDLAALLGAWGPCEGFCESDLDGDRFVGPADLGILLGAWPG